MNRKAMGIMASAIFLFSCGSGGNTTGDKTNNITDEINNPQLTISEEFPNNNNTLDSISLVKIGNFPDRLEKIAFEKNGNLYTYSSNGALLDGYVKIFEVSNPENVKHLSTLQPLDVKGLALENNTLYILTPSELLIVDINSKEKPNIANRIPLPEDSYGRKLEGEAIFKEGNKLYILAGDGFGNGDVIVVYDITDNLNPIYLGIGYTSDGSGFKFIKNGNYLYLLSRNKFYKCNFISLDNISCNLSIDVYDGRDFIVDNKYAYISDDRILAVVDISKSDNLSLVYQHYKSFVDETSNYDAYSIDKSGNLVFLLDENRVADNTPYGNIGGHLRIFDVSDPTNIKEIYTLNAFMGLSDSYDIFVKDDIIYSSLSFDFEDYENPSRYGAIYRYNF